MNAIAKIEQPKRSLIADMADEYGMDAAAFQQTLKATVVPANVTNEDFAAFLLVAKHYKLNPILKEIFAFPKRGGGIQPIVSVDGWCNLINSHPGCDGFEFVDALNDKGGLVSITCKMYRKDRAHPVSATEYMAECVRDTDPWKQWPRRMLRHKALIQAARYAFGFAGIMDQDEAERIVPEGHYANTPGARLTPPPAPSPTPPAAPALENKPGVTLDASVKKEPEKVLAETRADTVYDQRTPAPRTQTKPEPHDPETGEVGSRALPVPVEGGKERFAPWGKSLIEAIMASKSHAEVDAWREANKFILERCEQTAPKAYASVQKAISQRANELMEGQKKSPKGAPEAAAAPDAGYKDWLRDAYAELAQCMNEPAVEELRERISDELKAADQIVWRDSCAEKATELFGGKRR